MSDSQHSLSEETSRQSGFGIRWIGVIAVIVFLGILLGLVLPAIAQIREAARRTQCQNNLKQLALAVHNYEAAFKKLPIGIQVLPGGNDSADTLAGNWNWSVFLFPYIEAGSSFHILDPLNFNNLSDRLLVESFQGKLRLQPPMPVPDPKNQKAEFLTDDSFEATLQTLACFAGAFRCPSDVSLVHQNDFRHGVTDSKGRIVSWPGSNKVFNLGITNYVAANSSRQCYGLTAGSANGETISFQPDGVFHAVRPTRLRDVRDGQAITVLFSERIYGSLTPRKDRKRFGRPIPAGAATVFGSRGIGNSTIDGSATNDCADAWGPPDVMFSAWGGINLDDPAKPWRKFQGVSSYHPGGVNVARVDGSVHFMLNIPMPGKIEDYFPFEPLNGSVPATGNGDEEAAAAGFWRRLISISDGTTILTSD